MVDITSLKARLAKLRLGSEFDDKHPDLADPVTKERKKKQKKAAQDPYNQYTKNPNKRKKNNKLTRSDQKRGKKVKNYNHQKEDGTWETDNEFSRRISGEDVGYEVQTQETDDINNLPDRGAAKRVPEKQQKDRPRLKKRP